MRHYIRYVTSNTMPRRSFYGKILRKMLHTETFNLRQFVHNSRAKMYVGKVIWGHEQVCGLHSLVDFMFASAGLKWISFNISHNFTIQIQIYMVDFILQPVIRANSFIKRTRKKHRNLYFQQTMD